MAFLSVHLFWRELRFRYCAARGGRSYFCRWRGDYVVYRLHDPQAAFLCGHTVAVLSASWDAMVRSRRGLAAVIGSLLPLPRAWHAGSDAEEEIREL